MAPLKLLLVLLTASTLVPQEAYGVGRFPSWGTITYHLTEKSISGVKNTVFRDLVTPMIAVLKGAFKAIFPAGKSVMFIIDTVLSQKDWDNKKLTEMAELSFDVLATAMKVPKNLQKTLKPLIRTVLESFGKIPDLPNDSYEILRDLVSDPKLVGQLSDSIEADEDQREKNYEDFLKRLNAREL